MLVAVNPIPLPGIRFRVVIICCWLIVIRLAINID